MAPLAGITDLFSDPLFILRIALVVILYLVVLQIVSVSRREMRRAARGEAFASAPSQVVGHLIVIDAGSTSLTPGARLNIEPLTTLGRSPTNTIALESTFVSTEHTRIIYRDRSLWVEDVGSRNGTYVDQRQVNGAVAVSPGSVLQVGDVRFKFAV